MNATWAHLLERTFGDELAGLPDLQPNGGDRWMDLVRAC